MKTEQIFVLVLPPHRWKLNFARISKNFAALKKYLSLRYWKYSKYHSKFWTIDSHHQTAG